MVADDRGRRARALLAADDPGERAALVAGCRVAAVVDLLGDPVEVRPVVLRRALRRLSGRGDEEGQDNGR
jgi:hypothetical protein